MKQETQKFAGELATALKREIVEASKKVRTFSITGAEEEQHGDRHVLNLTLDRTPSGKELPNRPLECGQVTLTDGTLHSVELLSRSKRVVRVLAPPNLEASALRGATLRIDTVWLLERQLEAIRQVVAEIGKPPLKGEAFRYDLALLSVRYSEDLPPVSVSPISYSEETCAELLNEVQLRCLQRAATTPVSLIWGPPGTGKSRTLAEIAVTHAVAGQRVLVVSPSNATADQLVTGCARRYAQVRSAPLAGQVLRWGKRWTDDLAREAREDVLLDRAAATQARHWLDLVRRGPTHPEVPAAFLQSLVPDTVSNAHRTWAAEHLFKTAQIVVCPVAHLFLYRTRFQGAFDTVLIDEASMLTLPTIWLAGGYARSRVVIAGDPSQLGTPLITRHPLLRQSVFARHGATPQRGEEEGDTWIMLTEQHRMIKPICNLVSGAFYGGRLVTAHSLRRTPVQWPWDPDAGCILVVDSSEIERTSQAPYAVLEHAQSAVTIGSELTKVEGPDRPNSVLLLSAYRNQVEQMQALRVQCDSKEGNAVMRVSTIHGAQGSEADTVVLTIDDSPQKPQFLGNRNSQGQQLLNVAMSRAKRGIVVIGPLEQLSKSALVDNGVRRALLALLEHATIKDASTHKDDISPKVLALTMR